MLKFALAALALTLSACHQFPEVETISSQLKGSDEGIKDFESFQTALSEFNPHIDSLTNFLAKIHPHMRSNFILRMGGQGTEEFPLVKFFSKDGRFQVWFHGDESREDFNQLGVVRFNEDDLDFEFYKVEFAPGEMPVVSRKQPKDVFSGLGFSNYPKWFSYYGQLDDELFPDEAAGFFNFREEIVPVNPRYQNLIFTDTENPAHPFRMVGYKDDKMEWVSHSRRPNLRKTQMLTHLLGLRTYGVLRNLDHFSKYRMLIARTIYSEVFKKCPISPTQEYLRDEFRNPAHLGEAGLIDLQVTYTESVSLLRDLGIDIYDHIFVLKYGSHYSPIDEGRSGKIYWTAILLRVLQDDKDAVLKRFNGNVLRNEGLYLDAVDEAGYLSEYSRIPRDFLIEGERQHLDFCSYLEQL